MFVCVCVLCVCVCVCVCACACVLCLCSLYVHVCIHTYYAAYLFTFYLTDTYLCTHNNPFSTTTKMYVYFTHTHTDPNRQLQVFPTSYLHVTHFAVLLKQDLHSQCLPRPWCGCSCYLSQCVLPQARLTTSEHSEDGVTVSSGHVHWSEEVLSRPPDQVPTGEYVYGFPLVVYTYVHTHVQYVRTICVEKVK